MSEVEEFVRNLGNAELYQELGKRGIPHGPVVG